LELNDKLIEDKVDTGVLMTSGTASFPIALDYQGFKTLNHRVGAGTPIYWDDTSAAFGETGFKYAATVLTRVLSRPTDHHFTCDAGSKAVAAETSWPVARVDGSNTFEGKVPSEEHFPFNAPDGDAPKAGSLVELIPKHVCPTVNLAEKALFLEKDTPVAVVDVKARAHAVGPFGPKVFAAEF